MLDSFIIVGLTIVIVNVIKSFSIFDTVRGKLFIPLIVFVVAGLLNVTNALIFNGELLTALKEGFILGASAGGIYSMGKKAIENRKAIENKKA